MRPSLRAFVALMLAVSWTTLIVVGAGASAGTIDQQLTSWTNVSAVGDLGTWNHENAQTFTAGRSGALDQLDLALYRFDCKTSPVLCGGVGDLKVELMRTAGGVPSGTPLATATVPSTSIPLGKYPSLDGLSWISVPIGPVPVTAATQYAIVLSSTGMYAWGLDETAGGPYLGGSTFSRDAADSSSAWFGPQPSDKAFKTYVKPSPLLVQGAGVVIQQRMPVGMFAVDMSYDGVAGKGSMFFALRVTYQGQPGYLTASSTSPRLAYVECKAGKPASATFSGDGSFVLRSLRGSVLLRGTGYIKASVEARNAGALFGYVAPTGPPFMPEIVFPDSTFFGHLDVNNAYCPT
jgi:hypothetical protein